MAFFGKTNRTRMKRNVAFYVAYLALVAVVSVAAAEFVLRQKGIRPWQAAEIVVKVEPPGGLFQAHPTLGYTNLPGSFVVTLPTGFTYRTTHLPNALRITRPLSSYDQPGPKDSLWIFGCSMTYGLSLNNEETYPWLLQEKLPDYDVVDFAVPGYGTTQSLIQFREALEAAAPKAAVLAYANFHDQRNTFSRIRRKEVAPWNYLGEIKYPFARLVNGALELRAAEVDYREFPLMRHLALSHYLETTYDRLEYRWHQGPSVSEAIIAEMAALARQHDVQFVLANINGGGGMLEWAERKGIPAVDISLDLRIAENTNAPHDGHPSALAARKYARTLESFLRTKVFGRSAEVLNDH